MTSNCNHSNERWSDWFSILSFFHSFLAFFGEWTRQRTLITKYILRIIKIWSMCEKKTNWCVIFLDMFIENFFRRLLMERFYFAQRFRHSSLSQNVNICETQAIFECFSHFINQMLDFLAKKKHQINFWLPIIIENVFHEIFWCVLIFSQILINVFVFSCVFSLSLSMKNDLFSSNVNHSIILYDTSIFESKIFWQKEIIIMYFVIHFRQIKLQC